MFLIASEGRLRGAGQSLCRSRPFIFVGHHRAVVTRRRMRIPALVSVLVSMVALIAAVAIDGFATHCNEPIPPQCTGFDVPWVGFSATLAATVALAVLVSVLPESTYRRARSALCLALAVGCAASALLLLHTGPVAA